MLTLSSFEKKIAQEDTPCDASKDFFNLFHNSLDSLLKSRYLPVLFENRRCKIPKGEYYWHYEFADENGELHELNCGKKINNFMVKQRLYPLVILTAIDDFIKLKNYLT